MTTPAGTRAWCGRLLLFAALLFGIVTMHTLGHPTGGPGSMTPAVRMDAAHGGPGQVMGAGQLSGDHGERAAAPHDPVGGPAAGGHEQPGHGLDPMAVCLAVLLAAVTLALLAEGKKATALALLRTGAGSAPKAGVRPRELSGAVLTADRLKAAESVALPARTPDRTIRIRLTGGMAKYDWAFDGKPYDPAVRHGVRAGERVRLTFTNGTAMWHPLHLHGHTFALAGTAAGARKDTAVILPNSSLSVDVDADNPGLWMIHCHNVYHAESGMMTVLGYLS